MEIRPIRIPRNIISEIPPPVLSGVEPPITRGVKPPIINMPEFEYEYPTIDVPTEEEWEQMVRDAEAERERAREAEVDDTRDLPETVEQPTITVAGIEAPLPEVAPLVTAGATAVVTTGVTLGATIIVGKLKDAADPLIRSILERRKKKIKIKAVKPVLHFVDGEQHVDIFEYSGKGTKLLDTTDNIERYIRDQVELSSLYEFDNALIIDDVLKSKFTKEGQKRFKKHFRPAKVIAKKLSAKLSLL
jgi:hypothetical protein